MPTRLFYTCRQALFSLMMLLLSVSSALAESLEDFGASSGMPQLNPQNFTSQIFWLGIAFCVLYWLMHKFALPYVRSIIDLREHTIQGNLEEAGRIRSEAQDIKIAYDKALRDAHYKAETILKEEEREIEAEMTAALEKANQDAARKIAQAEEAIDRYKKDMINAMDDLSETLAVEMFDQISTDIPKAALQGEKRA